MTDGDEFFSPYGPIGNPSKRFAHLPEPTREWLEQLREDDIREINDALRFWRAIRAGSWLIKWSVGLFLAMFLGIVAFGEAIQKLLSWISLGARQ